MKIRFCGYCGSPLENGCDCERQAAEDRRNWLDDYYNDKEVQYGWYHQDMIDLRRRER